MTKANFLSRTIYTGDNLNVLRGFNTGSVDLIYLDPPFNSNRRHAAAPESQASGALFKDTWTTADTDPAWVKQIQTEHPRLNNLITACGETGGPSTEAYLTMMAVRLIEMRRVLKNTGSIYLHCDPTESHALKLIMDNIFGRAHFRNEIVWCYSTGGASKNRFAAKHDIILIYRKTGEAVFNTLRVPYTSAMSKDPKHQHKFHPEGKIMLDWWADIPPVNPMSSERTGYPTQKPLALLERIISAASNPGDMVLDPFLGCATTAAAAEKLGREWTGIDISGKSYDLACERLRNPSELTGVTIYRHFRPPERTDFLPPS